MPRHSEPCEGASWMSKCPACDHDVRAPFFLNLDAWSHLACTQCKTRLEMKPPRSALFAPLIAPLFVLARQSRIVEAVAFLFMFGTFFLLLLECLHPRVQLRLKPAAKPEIRVKRQRPLELASRKKPALCES